jgi:hypothetical protein
MRLPPPTKRGWRPQPWPLRSATFRFVAPPRFHLLREPTAARQLLKAMQAANANTDAPDAPWRTRQTRAGETMPARRTAEKRPPAHGEMEHVHDTYGGVFADRLDPGSA